MQLLPYILAAVLVGALISAQPAWNALIARSIGSSFGAVAINTFIALCCSLALLAWVGTGRISVATLIAAPWWAYLAGVVGAVFVASGVFIAPVTGALVFFVCVITGQLIGSTLADHFGAFGLEVKEFSLSRMLGLAMVISGAILVSTG